MKKIKDGKLVLDGTITQNELQDKVNKAFEILCEYDLKKSDITRFATYKDFIKNCYLDIDGNINDKCPTEEQFNLLKEVI